MTKKFKPKSSHYWLEYSNGLLLTYSSKTEIRTHFINLRKVEHISFAYNAYKGVLGMYMLNGYYAYLKVRDESEYTDLSKYLFGCLKEANTVRTTTL